MDTIATTVFAQSLSNFTCTCRLWMMRGGPLFILGHGVIGQGQLCPPPPARGCHALRCLVCLKLLPIVWVFHCSDYLSLYLFSKTPCSRRPWRSTCLFLLSNTFCSLPFVLIYVNYHCSNSKLIGWLAQVLNILYQDFDMSMTLMLSSSKVIYCSIL